MRIGHITLSPVAFYSEPLWNLSISYRVFLVIWRALELGFVSARLILFRAPILLIWTRIPLIKSITLPGPYKTLQPILAPSRDVKLAVAGGRMGEFPAWAESLMSADDVRKETERLKSLTKPPDPIKVAVGGVIRGLMTELGSVFIKLSQILSMRPEMPPFIREELAEVQDKLPGLPKEEVNTILERELMRPVNMVFEWIDYDPVAAASLAVVHHAKLRDGREVALKIQRPFLQGKVVLDSIVILRIVLGAVKLVFPQLRKTDLTFFTLSFESALMREIDFELEGRVQERAKRAFMASQQTAAFVKIADVYTEYSTTKLLTMEFVHGFLRLDQMFTDLTPEETFEFLCQKVPGFSDDIPLQLLVCVGSRFPMQLGWQGEVFHGDLHMGNIYLRKPSHPGDNWGFFLCDFGMFEDIPREGYLRVMQLFRGLFTGDISLATSGLKALHLEAGGRLSDVDWAKVQVEFANFGRTWLEDAPDEQSGIRLRKSKPNEGGLTRNLLKLLYGFALGGGLRFPYWFWLFVKAYVYLEEIAPVVTGGSYDWLNFIFDQYFVRMEKDSVLRAFDRTNVFTVNRTVDMIEPMMTRKGDYIAVLDGFRELFDDFQYKRLDAAAVLREVQQ
ncbi:MAG: AarF/UbiB family protein [Chloroflexota bacterium]|nr:AarF/UbiB family protein [Chloroflexota bacterium]